MKKLLLALCGFFVVLSANAQNPAASNEPILLLNHTLNLQSNTLDALNYRNSEVVNGKIYRIVQDANLKLHTHYNGLYTLEYLPKNAFLVSIEVEKIQKVMSLLQSHQAAVGTLNPSYKLSKKLFNSDIPDWAWLNDSEIKVWLNYYSDLNHQEVLTTLSKSYIILDESANDHLVSISISPDRIDEISALPYVMHVQEMEEPGKPENDRARPSHRVNYLQAKYPNTPNYDGKGIVIGHGDDGAIDFHLDFTGRLTVNSGSSNGDHGDHVAGTIFGAGNLDPDGKGMAPGAEIYYQSYSGNPTSQNGNLGAADFNYVNHNVRITSSSYSNGCNAGYTNYTRVMDQDAIDNPNLVHVFSAGNNGTSACSGSNDYGAGNVWGNITGGHKIAKNVIATANLTYNDGIASSSSRGPASDGRIKPDLGAVGTSVYSTTDIPSPNSYTRKTGTSMACPGVSGTMATLYEAYKTTYSVEPHGGLMKAITMNTCDDLGNEGPDFKYGFGRLNARKAVELIEDGNFLTDSISTGTKTFQITPPSSGTVKSVKIMLYWPDAPASTIAARALVNDLDMEVTLGGTTYQPYVLDPRPNPVTLNLPAVPARDSLNNVEQIVIQNPASGTISVSVDAFNVPSANQKFFIVYYFEMDEITITYPAGGEGFSPGNFDYIRWDAPDGTGSFVIDYSTDNGTTWTTLNSNIPSTTRLYFWGSVPNIITDQALVRVSRGTVSGQSPGNFSILGQVQNLAVASSCPDSLQLVWDSVSGATGYVIYKMGPKYMDSIFYSTTHSVILPKNNLNVEEWYSVAAKYNTGVAKRAIAIKRPTGLVNCIITKDLELSQLNSPAAAPPQGAYTDCFSYPPTPVEVNITNVGVDPAWNITVNYKFNNGLTVTEIISDTIVPSSVYTHTFSGSVSLIGGNNLLQIWLSFAPDQNAYNDSINQQIDVLTGTNKVIAFTEDFESFNNCGTANDCEVTVCPLVNGWVNVTNGVADDIDWRVDNGGTPSNNTGPSLDHNPGTSAGNYLYLEASGGCDSNVAMLLSPCIFLDSTLTSNVVAEFWYHMNGTDMGKLSVDVLVDDTIIRNVMTPIKGNQGNSWKKASISLNAYLGKSVVVRLRGKTGNGFLSDIAIDDFSVFDPSVLAPTANYSTSDTVGCVGSTVVFTDLSSSNASNFLWDFGQGASPATATGAGPHNVTYNSTGQKVTSLEASTAGGTSKKVFNIDIEETPVADYNYSTILNIAYFQSQALNNPTSYSWDFGDGQTSTQASPQNNYTNAGWYQVSLTCTNDCGTDVYSDSVFISSGVGLNENHLGQITLFPNPTEGSFTIELPSALTGNVDISIYSLMGKLVRKSEFTLNKERSYSFDLNQLADGIYIVSIKTNEGTKNIRLVKDH